MSPIGEAFGPEPKYARQPITPPMTPDLPAPPTSQRKLRCLLSTPDELSDRQSLEPLPAQHFVSRLAAHHSVLCVLDDIRRYARPEAWQAASTGVLESFWTDHAGCLMPPQIQSCLSSLGNVARDEIRYQRDVFYGLGTFADLQTRFARGRTVWRALLAAGDLELAEVISAEFVTDHLFLQRALLDDLRAALRKCPVSEPACSYVSAVLGRERMRTRPSLCGRRAMAALGDLSWVWQFVGAERTAELAAIAGGYAALRSALVAGPAS